MSFEDGWAAINLEMPSRVPRTELDAERHWDLVREVTGIEVNSASPPETQDEGRRAFMQAWNYDLTLGNLIGGNELLALKTNMGHSVWAAGGVDYDDDIVYPFTDVEQVLAFDPWEAYGKKDKGELIRRFEEHYRRQCETHPTMVSMTGVYITLITGLTYAFGWEMLLLAAGTDPHRFGEVTNRYASWMQQYYDALAETNVPVCYCHDDMVWASGAVFRPQWYRTYVFPNLRKLFSPLIDAGKKVTFVCDGNYEQFVDDILDIGVHGFFMEPRYMDLAYMAERCGQTHYLVGNVDTRVLLLGSEEQIRAEVERNLAIGKRCPGYFMCASNAIPANTPVQSALF